MTSEKVLTDGWRCSACKNIHWTQVNADNCCTCRMCNAKATSKGGYNYTCPKCSRAERLKSGRELITRLERELKSENERHAFAIGNIQRHLNSAREEHAKLKEEKPA